MDNRDNAFASAYLANKQRRGELGIGVAHTREQFTHAGVPEEYGVVGLQRDMHPGTIIQLWGIGASMDFIAAFLEGHNARDGRATADSSVTGIRIAIVLLRNRSVPDEYALPLLRMGSAPLRIAALWDEGIAVEYAQQLLIPDVT